MTTPPPAATASSSAATTTTTLTFSGRMIPPSDVSSLERTLTRMLFAMGVRGPPIGFLSNVYWVACCVSAVDIDTAEDGSVEAMRGGRLASSNFMLRDAVLRSDLQASGYGAQTN